MRQFGELEAVIMDRLWEWARVLPLISLTRETTTQVTRLIEMHADDVATAARDV